MTEQLGSGEALPHAQRAKFERSLGRDLSAVRVHTGDAAAGEADRVGARAYASGPDIVFAKGAYNPFDWRGLYLLAHEVAHTAQQQGAAPAGELATTQPGDPAERDADAAAAAMLGGRPAPVSAQPMSIARRTGDESIPEPPSTADMGAPDAGPDGGGSDGATGSAARSTPDASAAEGEIGELSAERVGQEPDEGEDVGPDVPVRDPEAGKQDIAAAGQQLPPEGGAEDAAAGIAPDGAAASAGDAGGAGEGGAVDPAASAAITEAQSDTREAVAQAEAESAAYKADTLARRERFEAEQHATMLEQLKTMSAVEKRQTLQEMGYDPKQVKKLKDGEIDGLIEGKMEAEARKTRILGMTPEELAALSPAQKIQYLVDLGIDRGDLDKAGEAKATRLFDDIMQVAHVPGQHKVKIKIKGGLMGRSWEVTVKCDAEDNVDIQAEKQGGFLSKLWGWVKIALPVILTVLAPLTAGVSLIVLGVYQAATAIKNGDWLGAVIGAVTAIGGLSTFTTAIKGLSTAARTLSKVADLAKKAQKVAQAAQAAMTAVKTKNAGSLLGALAKGAAAFADLTGKYAAKFAATMERWAGTLDKWSKVIGGGEKIVQGVKKGDPVAAIGGAFDAAAALLTRPKDKRTTGAAGEAADPKSGSVKALESASKITGFINTGRRALEARPPNYAAVAEAGLGIAAQLEQDRRLDDAARVVSSANRLKQAWDHRETDPGALADAALGLAEAIQLAKQGVENEQPKDDQGKPLPDSDRDAIIKRYQTADLVVHSAGAVLTAATTRPRPDYVRALDAATQLIAGLTESKQLDAAAVVTSKLDAWTRAVNGKDDNAIREAGLALGQAVDGMRQAIADEHAQAKQDAEAKLPPDQAPPAGDAGELPQVELDPPELLASKPIDPALVSIPAIDPSSPPELDAPSSGRSNTPGANYTVMKGDTLSDIAQRFKTSVAALRTLNSQLVDDRIYRDQKLYVPGAEILLPTDVTISEKYRIDDATAAEAERTRVMAQARVWFDTATAEIANWRTVTGNLFAPGLGGAFQGGLLDLERNIARLGTYVDNPGIGTNVVRRETEYVQTELQKTRDEFDRLNGTRSSVIDVELVVAKIVRESADVVLDSLDEDRLLSAGYKGVVAAIDEYNDGGSRSAIAIHGALAAVIQVVPGVDEVLRSAVTEGFREVAGAINDYMAELTRHPEMTDQEKRALQTKYLVKVPMMFGMGAVKGQLDAINKGAKASELKLVMDGALYDLFKKAADASIGK